MDYPKPSAWRAVLLSPKMLGIILWFTIFDHYILGGALPYLAACCCGYLGTHFSWNHEPPIEIVTVVIIVFLLMFTTLRIGIETWFWRKLFLMDKNYYCVLAVRDFINCWSVITNIMEMVKVIYRTQEYGLRKYNLGEGTQYVFLVRLREYGFTFIDDSLLLSTMPAVSELCSKEPCLHNSIAINSTELLISVALIASSIARLLYINSLYSYMSAVDLLSELDPFLQVQLRFDERNGNSPQTRPPRSAFSRPDENSTSRGITDNINTIVPPVPLLQAQGSDTNSSAPRVQWPLSFFVEDAEEDYPG